MTIRNQKNERTRKPKRIQFQLRSNKEAVLFFYYSLRLQQLDIFARLVAGGVPIVSSSF